MHEDALAIRREIGDRGGMAQSLLNIGDVLVPKGDLKSARKNVQESLALSRKTGDGLGISTALQNLAGIVADQGDLTGLREHTRGCWRLGAKSAIKVRSQIP
jgi:hypothetical protein